MKIEVNPQEVMVLAQQMLEGGWIQGSERGRKAQGRNVTQDPSGVCVVGALRQTLTQILRPQIEATLICMPEFMAQPLRFKRDYVDQETRVMAQRLLDVFRPRIQAVMKADAIESWNDTPTRQKNEVLNAMRASLDVITAECNRVWEAEGAAEIAKAEERSKHFEQPADAVEVLKH